MWVAAVMAAAPACSIFALGDEYTAGTQPPSPNESDGQVAPETASTFDADPTEAAADAGDGAKPGAAYVAAVMADLPTAYHRFEEVGVTTAADEMGAFPGVYVNNPILGVDGIIPGTRAMQFGTGTRSRVSVAGDRFRLAGVTPFSLELWVKPASFTSYLWIGGTEKPYPTRHGWSILADGDGRVLFEIWRPPPADSGAAGNVRYVRLDDKLLVTGRYQHIVITYDGAVTVGYVDGVEVDRIPSTEAAPDIGDLIWGCRRQNENVNGCIDGWSLDEVAVYGKALSANRVRAHFEAAQ